MLRRPSNGRCSAGLNWTELQRGHSRRIPSGCGSQSGQFQFVLLILRAPFEDSRCKLKSLRLCWVRIRVQPGKQRTNAARSQRHTGIACSVIQIDSVSICADGLSARKHDVFHVSATLIRCFRTEDPGITSLQADLRTFQIEEREAQAIDASPMRFASPRDRLSASPLRFLSAESIVQSCLHPTIRRAELRE